MSNIINKIVKEFSSPSDANSPQQHQELDDGHIDKEASRIANMKPQGAPRQQGLSEDFTSSDYAGGKYDRMASWTGEEESASGEDHVEAKRGAANDWKA